MEVPAVSVVIPVLNEAKDIGTLLMQLKQQSRFPGGFEVLVVDGGSADDTRLIVTEIGKTWPSLVLLENPDRRSSPARNVGARSARGRYVLFVDGHCSIPRKDYLIRLVEIFEDSAADCLCRPQPLGELGRGAWGQAIALARHSRFGHDPGSDIYGGEPRYTEPHSAGAAYRREIFDRIAGFDERFDACEDVEFNYRVCATGFRAYFHPDLAVHYRPRDSLPAFFRQMFRYGRGRGRLALCHPRLVPWTLVMATGLSLSLPALLVVPGGAAGLWLVAAVTGTWLFACLGEGARLGRGPGQACRVATALSVIHVGLTAGFFRGLLDYSRFRSPMGGKVKPATGGRHAAL
jgi:succinoglycan biosynthesis protein ExoA